MFWMLQIMNVNAQSLKLSKVKLGEFLAGWLHFHFSVDNAMHLTTSIFWLDGIFISDMEEFFSYLQWDSILREQDITLKERYSILREQGSYCVGIR